MYGTRLLLVALALACAAGAVCTLAGLGEAKAQVRQQPAKYRLYARLPWAPPRGQRAKYRFLYYPDSQVYYDLQRALFYWWDDGGWQSGSALPEGFKRGRRNITLPMNTSVPIVHHKAVRRKYPPRKPRQGRRR